ncbi:hypothetical protein H5410_027921, partial [Solanum commersonii]
KSRQTPTFSTLPHEAVLDIFCRLLIRSIIQLIRSVCKSGYEILPDPELVHLQLSQAVKNNPYFIFHFDYPIKNQLYYVELSDHEHKGLVRKLSFVNINVRIQFSRLMYWLIMVILKFNLVGSCNDILKFIEFEEQQVVFRFHPFTKEYKVIKIVYYTNSYNIP